MEKEVFRRFGHEIIDWLADYLENTERYRIVPDLRPGEIKAKLPAAPPAAGEPMEDVLRDFREVILPGVTHWQHPGWFAYFPANNSPASALGEATRSLEIKKS